MTKRKEIPVSAPQMETPEIRWRDKDAISDLLFCTICQDVFTNPMRISCGHSFCKVCLESWLVNSRYQECPTCRQTVIKNGTHRDLLAQAFLEREDVFCSVRSCHWMGPLSDLKRHLDECKDSRAKEDAELFPDRTSKSNKDLSEGVSETRKRLLASGKLHELFQELNEQSANDSSY